MRKPVYAVAVDGSEIEPAGRLKHDCVTAYGGKCMRCGEKDPEVLSVYPRRRNGEMGTLYWLRKRNWPKQLNDQDVYLICGNCKKRRDSVQS